MATTINAVRYLPIHPAATTAQTDAVLDAHETVEVVHEGETYVISVTWAVSAGGDDSAYTVLSAPGGDWELEADLGSHLGQTLRQAVEEAIEGIDRELESGPVEVGETLRQLEEAAEAKIEADEVWRGLVRDARGLGVTVRAVATVAGCSPQTVQNIVHDRDEELNTELREGLEAIVGRLAESHPRELALALAGDPGESNFVEGEVFRLGREAKLDVDPGSENDQVELREAIWELLYAAGEEAG